MPDQPKLENSSADTPLGKGLALLRNLWRRLENIMFGLVLLLIILYFILQMPAVQNWLIGKVTNYLSDELKTKVELRHIDVAFFDNSFWKVFIFRTLRATRCYMPVA